MNFDHDLIILMYYFVKRLFLFLDEWTFYYVLYKFYKAGYYKTLLMIMIYGTFCIYTSYTNISLIESEILNVDQVTLFIPSPIFEVAYYVTHYFHNHIRDFLGYFGIVIEQLQLS